MTIAGPPTFLICARSVSDTGGEHYQDDADLRDEPETGHSGVGQDDLTGNVFDETDDHSGKEHSDDRRELDSRAELS